MHTHLSDPFLLFVQLCGGGGLQNFQWLLLQFHVCFTLIHYRHSRHFFLSREDGLFPLYNSHPPTHTPTQSPSLSLPSPWPVPLLALPSPPLPLPDLSLTHISISLLMNIKTVSYPYWPFLIHTTPSQYCVHRVRGLAVGNAPCSP